MARITFSATASVKRSATAVAISNRLPWDTAIFHTALLPVPAAFSVTAFSKSTKPDTSRLKVSGVTITPSKSSVTLFAIFLGFFLIAFFMWPPDEGHQQRIRAKRVRQDRLC